jgi:hypothetical protein
MKHFLMTTSAIAFVVAAYLPSVGYAQVQKIIQADGISTSKYGTLDQNTTISTSPVVGSTATSSASGSTPAPSNYGNSTWSATTRQLEWDSLSTTQKQGWIGLNPQKTTPTTPTTHDPVSPRRTAGTPVVSVTPVVGSTRPVAAPSYTTRTAGGSPVSNNRSLAPTGFNTHGWDHATAQREWNSLSLAQKTAWLKNDALKAGQSGGIQSTPAPSNYGNPAWSADMRQKEWDSLTLTQKSEWLKDHAQSTGAAAPTHISTPAPSNYGNTSWNADTRQKEWDSLSLAEKTAWRTANTIQPTATTPAGSTVVGVSSDGRHYFDAAGNKYVRDDDNNPGALYHAVDGSGKTIRIDSSGANTTQPTPTSPAGSTVPPTLVGASFVPTTAGGKIVGAAGNVIGYYNAGSIYPFTDVNQRPITTDSAEYAIYKNLAAQSPEPSARVPAGSRYTIDAAGRTILNGQPTNPNAPAPAGSKEEAYGHPVDPAKD